LFLNKRDLFEEKIKSIDLRHEGGDGTPPRFLDYTRGCDTQSAKQYITDRFLELRLPPVRMGGKSGHHHHHRARPIYPHVTCATDTSNIKLVFNVCKETIIHENLKTAGMTD
jgi:guanine nucleotide-binding protein G(i) subunit alpha